MPSENTMLFENILETIGRTPLVRIRKLSEGLKCRLFAKCEFFNPGGSVKDRAAFFMLQAAEKDGLLSPGDTLIEPTSGNTGIGLALAGAVKGYRVIIVMPDKMSEEKEIILKSLGAEIVRTPAAVPFDHPESHISRAREIQKTTPRSHILDQYANPNNFKAHYQSTAEEILEDLNNQVDMLVAGAGTGGTLTGLSRRLREVCPQCEIIGVDPEGSVLSNPKEPVRPYQVEGIGYDFVPKNLDQKAVTKWVKTRDRESFQTALLAIKKEGLLCGGSSGAALWAALKEARRLKSHQACVVILPDGIRNYMSKFLNARWMGEQGFS